MAKILKTAPLDFEKEIWQSGIAKIAGVDEVGRGPLAGPVVAAAVILPEDEQIDGVIDSKLLSEKRREELFEIIQQKALAIGIGQINPQEIDRINVLEATKKAMKIAIGKCQPQPEFLLIDGNQGLPIYQQKTIINGDQKSHSIAAASIIAKVTRDRIMRKYHEIFPEYGFDSHKGYGTKLHCKKIAEVGASPIHRASFKRVAEHLRNPKNANFQILGKWGEDWAVSAIIENGLEIIRRNFHGSRTGEIDIIAKDGDVIALIEVKTGKSETELVRRIDEEKQEKIAETGEYFFFQHPEYRNLECRFDIVKVVYNKIIPEIIYEKDAFRL